MIPPTGHATAERHQSPATDIEPRRARPLLPVIRSTRPKLALVPLADLSSRAAGQEPTLHEMFFQIFSLEESTVSP